VNNKWIYKNLYYIQLDMELKWWK